MDIVTELDHEIEQARSTLSQQRLSSSSVSVDHRGKFVEDVLLATEWAIRLQLVRQVDGLSYERFRTLQQTYLEKLAALREEAWAMMGRDCVALRFALGEQVRVARAVAHHFAQEQKGVVPNWLVRAFTLTVATFVSEAEAAGALRDHTEGASLKLACDEQIVQALGGIVSTEVQS